MTSTRTLARTCLLACAVAGAALSSGTAGATETAAVGGRPVLLAQSAPSRLLQNLQRQTERQVERRVQRRLDNTIDKGLDSAENAIDGKSAPDQTGNPQPGPGNANSQSAARAEWTRFDFVPGDVVIFEDNLQGEKNGEFPSKWDLVGGVAENARFMDENVIYFRSMRGSQGIVPLMKHNPKNYLPEQFTLEFDAYFEPGVYNQTYVVNLFDRKNQKRLLGDLRIYINKMQYDGSAADYPGVHRGHIDTQAKWRRVSLSFNQRALKVYLDDARLINIPNLTENPTGITIRGDNSGNRQSFIKNIRIAQGAVPLYDKFLTDGKIVTNGIRFDVNQATIRPESTGVINEIVGLLKNHPEIRFSVEGHTDGDGGAALNQRLSEARAKAVMDRMVAMGISPGRLRFLGHGQGQPVAPNTTPEGKAQNRRVEFVKF